MIIKSKKGWKVVAKSGRNLGEYSSKEDAMKRLRQVEYYKNKK